EGAGNEKERSEQAAHDDLLGEAGEPRRARRVSGRARHPRFVTRDTVKALGIGVFARWESERLLLTTKGAPVARRALVKKKIGMRSVHRRAAHERETVAHLNRDGMDRGKRGGDVHGEGGRSFLAAAEAEEGARRRQISHIASDRGRPGSDVLDVGLEIAQ